MLNIGLTGGIGSGKSTVAQLLVERGAVLVDADVLAREVVAPGTPALAKIGNEFGPSILTPAGELDRPRMAELAFADPSAREKLNAIVHPAVRDAAQRRIQKAREENPQAIVVEDIPLLVETGAQERFHLVIVVEAPLETRLDRLEKRGLTRADAQARIRSQADDETRAQAADAIIRNESSLEDLRGRVDHVWNSTIMPRYRELLAEGTGYVTPGTRRG